MCVCLLFSFGAVSLEDGRLPEVSQAWLIVVGLGGAEVQGLPSSIFKALSGQSSTLSLVWCLSSPVCVCVLFCFRALLVWALLKGGGGPLRACSCV